MNSIEYADVSVPMFRVVVVRESCVNGWLIGTCHKCEEREFRTSREAFEFVKGITAEDALRYQTDGMPHLRFELQELSPVRMTSGGSYYVWHPLMTLRWFEDKLRQYTQYDTNPIIINSIF